MVASIASGAWDNTATWAGGVLPSSTESAVISSGHTITSVPSMAALFITIDGTLQFSRSVSSTLTIRRNFTVNNGGTWDMGTDASPIPLGINHNVVLNAENSSTTANMLSQFVNACGATFVGHFRTRNSTLTAQASSGQPVVVVADATGWQVGDQLVIAGNTAGDANIQTPTISAIAGNTVTLSANLTETKRIGTPISNFTSNLTFSSSTSNRASVAFQSNGSSASGRPQYIKNVAFNGLGNGGSGFSPGLRAAIGFRNFVTYNPITAISGLAIYSVGNASNTNSNALCLEGYKIHSLAASNIAIYSPTITPIWLADGLADLTISDLFSYDSNSSRSFFSGWGPGGFGVTIENSYFGGKANPAITIDAGSSIAFINTLFLCPSDLIRTFSSGDLSIANCTVNRIGNHDLAVNHNLIGYSQVLNTGNIALTNNNLSANTDISLLAGLFANPPASSYSAQITPNLRRITRAGGLQNDTSTINVNLNSLRLEPVSATNKLRQDFTLNIPANTEVAIIGTLRKNSSYGSSDRPFVTVFGAAISTATFTMSDSTDVWEEFRLTCTALSAAAVTVRVQAENTNTAARAFLGDLVFKAFGFSRAEILTFDPTITLNASVIVPTITSGTISEAAAITGISINFATRTITTTLARTVEQLINYHEQQWTLTLAARRIIEVSSLSEITIPTTTTLSLGAALTGLLTLRGILDLSVATSYDATVIEAAATAVIRVADGETIIRNIVATSGTQINLRAGATAATVFIPQAEISKITAGAGVTLRSLRVTFSGFPTGSNVNGVAYAAVISIRNTNDGTLFSDYTGGATYSKSLSEIGNGVGPFQVWGDGVGLRRTIAQTITAARSEPVSLDGLFQEFTAEDGTVLVGLAAADTGVTYEEADFRFEFTSGGHRFLGILHQFDAITSPPEGQSYDNTAVRGIQFIQNDSYQRILLPPAFTIAAAASAATSPLISDCLILNDDGTDARIPITELTSRPIVQFAFQVSVGLTAQQVADSLKLAPTAGSPAPTSVYGLITTVDTVADTIQAKTDQLAFIGGDVRATLDGEAVTVSSIATNVINADAIAPSAITEIAAAIPNAEANAAAVRTNLATELARIDQTIGSRATPADVFVSVSGGFLEGDRTALNNRASQDSINTLATAIAALPAPDNAGITAIRDKTDQIALIGGDVRATLDGETVATGLAVPSASDNATAVRTNLATELARIDDTITSRASQESLNNLPAPDTAAIATAVNNALLDDFLAVTNAIATCASQTSLDVLASAVGLKSSQASVDAIAEQLLLLYSQSGLRSGVTAEVLDAADGVPGYLTIKQGATTLASLTLTKQPNGAVAVTRTV